jgi:uncharacterized protein YukE
MNNDLDDESMVDISILSLPPHLRNMRLSSLTEKELRKMRNVLDRDIRHTNERLTEIQNAIRNTESQKENASKSQIHRLNQHIKTLRMNENHIKGDLKILYNLVNILKPFLKDEKLGAGRKKGGKRFITDGEEINNFILKHDLPSDIKKMRKLLNEAFEEIFLGDDATARQDLKQIGAILESYNVLLAPNTIENLIPADILERYDELLELLSKSGSGFSRERQTTNGNLRMKGGKMDEEYHSDLRRHRDVGRVVQEFDTLLRTTRLLFYHRQFEDAKRNMSRLNELIDRINNYTRQNVPINFYIGNEYLNAYNNLSQDLSNLQREGRMGNETERDRRIREAMALNQRMGDLMTQQGVSTDRANEFIRALHNLSTQIHSIESDFRSNGDTSNFRNSVRLARNVYNNMVRIYPTLFFSPEFSNWMRYTDVLNNITQTLERLEMSRQDFRREGSGFSRERETTNGNLRINGGMVQDVSDDDDEMSEMSEESNADEFPFQFNDVLDVIEELQDMNDDDERRERWNEMGVDVMMNDSNTNLEQEPHLVLTPQQETFVAQVQENYQFWRNHLFPPPQVPEVPHPNHIEGGIMSGGMVFPFYLQEIFDTLTNQFPQLSKKLQLLKWKNIEEKFELSFQTLDFRMDGNANLFLTPAQQRLVKDVYELYHRWKKILFPTSTGGRMSGGGLIGLLDSYGRVDRQILSKIWEGRAIKELSQYVNELKGKIGEINEQLDYFYEHWDKRKENPEINKKVKILEPLIQPLEKFREDIRARIPVVQEFHRKKIWKDAGAELFNADDLRNKANRPGFVEDINQQVDAWKKVFNQCRKQGMGGVYIDVKNLAENQIREYEAFINLVGI